MVCASRPLLNGGAAHASWEGGGGYPGAKTQRLACGQRTSKQIVEISKVWAIAPSTLELGCSHIKAELAEFVEGIVCRVKRACIVSRTGVRGLAKS
jgi:hypothetical protein